MKGENLLKAFGEKKQLNVLVDYGVPKIGIVALTEREMTDTPCRLFNHMAILFLNEVERDDFDELLFGCCQPQDPMNTKAKMMGFFLPHVETDRVFSEVNFYNLPSNRVDMHVLDDDFWEKLSEFDATFKKRHQRAVDEDSIEIHKLAFFLSDGSPQIYDWCYKNLSMNIDNFMNLWWILKTRLKYKSKQRVLKRGSITSYIGEEEIDDLIGEIVDMKVDADIAKTISEFNTQQRKLVKNFFMNTDDVPRRAKKLMMVMHRLPYDKRRNLIRKLSTVGDVDRIFEIISVAVGASFGWSKKSLLSHLGGMNGKLNLELVYDKDNVVILEINDFKTISYIGKATNWCITRDQEYWDNYTFPAENQQYVVLNFNLPENDEYSIVGVTIKDGWAICAAHSFTNKDLLFNPNLYFDLPRNQTIIEYLSGIGVMRYLLKRNTLSSFDTKKELLKYIDKSITKDYTVKEVSENKFAVISTSYKVGRYIANNLATKRFEMGLPMYSNSASYQLFIFLFDLNEKNNWARRMTTVLIDQLDSLGGMNGIMQSLTCDRIRALLSEWDVDLSKYVPIITDKFGKLSEAINDLNMDAVIDMVANDKEVADRVMKSIRIQNSMANMLGSIITMPHLDYVLGEKIDENNLPICIFKKKLNDNGLTFCNIINYFYASTTETLVQMASAPRCPTSGLYKKILLEFLEEENIDTSSLRLHVQQDLERILNESKTQNHVS